MEKIVVVVGGSAAMIRLHERNCKPMENEMLKRDELANPESCLNRAADDEMTFVLLGRDPAAPRAIRVWIEERIRLGKNFRDDDQIQEALRCIAEIEAGGASTVTRSDPR